MCSYKYLNAGMGGLGALYIHERFKDLEPGIKGRFRFFNQKIDPNYDTHKKF